MKTEGASGRTRKMNIRDYTVYIAFVAFFLIFTITLRNVGNGFANPNNLMNILRQTCLSAVMSVGMCCVIGAGQIDLSIGYVVGLSSVLTAMALNSWGIVPAILVGLAVGFVAGAVNGFLIAYLKLPAFLATLGTQMIWQGASRTISHLKAISIVNETFINIFGGGNIGMVPVLFVWMLVICVIGWIVLNKTSFGRKVLAVGGNARSAKYSGINIERVQMAVMIISGVLAALAGILWTGRFGGGRYSLGETSGTDVIAATVLGGASMAGGKASIAGAVFGSILIGMLNNALVMYGLDTHQQMMISGLVIILAVAVTIMHEPLK